MTAKIIQFPKRNSNPEWLPSSQILKDALAFLGEPIPEETKKTLSQMFDRKKDLKIVK